MASDTVRRQLEDAARAKARFCLATGVQPSEYDRLTDAEVDAFIDAANDRAEED